jgi:hypothetical protein
MGAGAEGGNSTRRAHEQREGSVFDKNLTIKSSTTQHNQKHAL